VQTCDATNKNTHCPQEIDNTTERNNTDDNESNNEKGVGVFSGENWMVCWKMWW
jgi:hypothetical protein